MIVNDFDRFPDNLKTILEKCHGTAVQAKTSLPVRGAMMKDVERFFTETRKNFDPFLLETTCVMARALMAALKDDLSGKPVSFLKNEFAQRALRDHDTIEAMLVRHLDGLANHHNPYRFAADVIDRIRDRYDPVRVEDARKVYEGFVKTYEREGVPPIEPDASPPTSEAPSRSKPALDRHGQPKLF